MIPRFVGLNFKERRNAILLLEQENQKYPEILTAIPLAESVRPDARAPFAAWRSREFCVQAFAESNGIIRLSVNRTHVDPATMRWLDGISWDDLQRLKGEAGFGDQEAVEVYPPDGKVVDVANMRHLWVLPERMPFSS